MRSREGPASEILPGSSRSDLRREQESQDLHCPSARFPDDLRFGCGMISPARTTLPREGPRPPRAFALSAGVSVRSAVGVFRPPLQQQLPPDPEAYELPASLSFSEIGGKGRVQIDFSQRLRR
ncbi:uncharacterized protein LOC103789070 [Callithrix jacchus]|uniref:uncharacterized protein LOC103789070 n=1 Tax=Callithrix jacchus TaxID=9483 RepID=UPI0004F0BC60|nr:uncharacterized protein LOC103789070 [Callithrix jacchus]